MEAKNLIQGNIYLDITDKKVPLQFTGVKKTINAGYNSYVVSCKFKTVRNEQNKNYDLPEYIYKNFPEDGNRDDIKQLEN